MMLSTPQIESIASLLRTHRDQVTACTAQLKQIRQTLAANDAGALAQQINIAEDLFLDLESTNLSCLQSIQSLGYPADADGLRKWVIDQNNSELNELKSELDARLGELKHALMVNDLLVRKNQDRVRHSIRILTGQQNQVDGRTYTAQGAKLEYAENPRMLARA
jgi:flagellar biosynthesis/type III secretory pathway chaperone